MIHRHPAISSSNPFRRKQDQILGLDNSSFRSPSDSVASVVGNLQEHQEPRSKPKRVRIISPRISRTSRESDAESSRSGSSSGGSSTCRSGGNVPRLDGSGRRSPAERENPFAESSGEDAYSSYSDRSREDIDAIGEEGGEGKGKNEQDLYDEDDDYNDDEEEDEEEGEEEEDPPASLPRATRRKRFVPDKANKTLNLAIDNPWRTSTVIGNLPRSAAREAASLPGGMSAVGLSRWEMERQRSLHGVSIPPKAQKTLGLGRQQLADASSKRAPAKALQDDFDLHREQSLSPPAAETDRVAPKALRTLGIPSNPFQRSRPTGPISPHQLDDPEEAEGDPPQWTGGKRMDVDEFKRLLLSGRRHPQPQAMQHAPYPQSPSADYASSTTDVSSSLSRDSMVSSTGDAHRFETPRSSHEILPEEFALSGSPHGFVPVPVRRQPLAQARPPPHQTLAGSTSVASLTDSTVDPAAVLTRPFGHEPPPNLATNLKVETSNTQEKPGADDVSSPTDLNKPLPKPPQPEIAYELPAGGDDDDDMHTSSPAKSRYPPAPPTARRRNHHHHHHHHQEQHHPVSELDAGSTVIAELSAEKSRGGAATKLSPSDVRAATKSAPAPPPPRRIGGGGSNRASLQPSVAELPAWAKTTTAGTRHARKSSGSSSASSSSTPSNPSRQRSSKADAGNKDSSSAATMLPRAPPIRTSSLNKLLPHRPGSSSQTQTQHLPPPPPPHQRRSNSDGSQSPNIPHPRNGSGSSSAATPTATLTPRKGSVDDDAQAKSPPSAPAPLSTSTSTSLFPLTPPNTAGFSRADVVSAVSPVTVRSSGFDDVNTPPNSAGWVAPVTPISPMRTASASGLGAIAMAAAATKTQQKKHVPGTGIGVASPEERRRRIRAKREGKIPDAGREATASSSARTSGDVSSVGDGGGAGAVALAELPSSSSSSSLSLEGEKTEEISESSTTGGKLKAAAAAAAATAIATPTGPGGVVKDIADSPAQEQEQPQQEGDQDRERGQEQEQEQEQEQVLELPVPETETEKDGEREREREVREKVSVKDFAEGEEEEKEDEDESVATPEPKLEPKAGTRSTSDLGTDSEEKKGAERPQDVLADLGQLQRDVDALRESIH